MLKLLFWTGVFVVFYAYLGYGLLLFALVKIKRAVWPPFKLTDSQDHFRVTFVVCAFNEANYISQKINNSLRLKFPSQNIRFVFVTDGSDDGTPNVAENAFQSANTASEWHVLHQPQRQGKIAAFQRAMAQFGQFPNCPDAHHIIISTDANTDLNPEAVAQLVACFANPAVGAAAGEKRIQMGEKDAANSAGEGIYWKYESLLKKWDAELWSVVGAAGELFAFRADAYEHVPPDSIVEDFFLTMRIAQKGFRVAYQPEAYAVETSSASVTEELKRKIRIAAGGLQSVVRLAPLLNVFKYGILSFQYISHRVLRWTLAPIFLPIVFIANAFLANQQPYKLFFIAQCCFYLFALIGYIFEQRQMKVKAFFVPYYFCIMNYAMYAGFLRLIRGNQSVLWEKSKRAT